VATDGHRLARFEMDLPDGASDVRNLVFSTIQLGQVPSRFWVEAPSPASCAQHSSAFHELP